MTRRTPLAPAFLCLLGTLGALGTGVRHPLAAQTVAGRVLDESRGSPVSGAVIRLLDAGDGEKAEVLADSLGRFTLAPPKDGRYVLEAVRLGYRTARSPLLSMHQGGDAVAVDLMMTPEPLGLEGFEVTVDEKAEDLLRPFGMTPRQLGQRWLDRDFIESIQVKRDIGAAIRWKAIPGVQVIDEDNVSPSKGPVFCIKWGAGVQGSCMLLVLNGAVVSDETVMLMDPDAFESVAVLRPMEATLFYGTLGGNGAVLFWTRQGSSER